MKNKRKPVTVEAVTHTHTHNTFYTNNIYLKSSTYFIKIGSHFIQKINKKIKDKLCKNVVCPFCVAKGMMDTG